MTTTSYIYIFFTLFFFLIFTCFCITKLHNYSNNLNSNNNKTNTIIQLPIAMWLCALIWTALDFYFTFEKLISSHLYVARRWVRVNFFCVVRVHQKTKTKRKRNDLTSRPPQYYDIFVRKLCRQLYWIAFWFVQERSLSVLLSFDKSLYELPAIS